MEEISIIGIDLAKNIFQVHGAARDGRPIFRKKVRRSKLLSLLTRIPACTVAMEACASSHYWGREIGKLGHTVKMIPPIYVKPYVKRQKNDANDAEAIAEAASRPTMRFVAVKSAENKHQAWLCEPVTRLCGRRPKLLMRCVGIWQNTE